MTANAPKMYDIAVEDVEYLRHGDMPLLARLFKPRGSGPFPLIVELHGGAWNLGDRLQDTDLNQALAQSGMVVAALDFRMPPVASYPASLADINHAIRWLKTQATKLGSRPDWVGAFGLSSGGHMAMLAAMRPHDPRYAAIPLPAGAPAVDASLRCVVMGAPVIDPLGRYRYAKQLKAGGKPYPEFVDLVLCTTSTGRAKTQWPRAARCGHWNAASGSNCRPCSIFKTPRTSSIPALTSTALWRSTAKRGAK
jgi:acetyl esterase/lipase